MIQVQFTDPRQRVRALELELSRVRSKLQLAQRRLEDAERIMREQAQRLASAQVDAVSLDQLRLQLDGAYARINFEHHPIEGLIGTTLFYNGNPANDSGLTGQWMDADGAARWLEHSLNIHRRFGYTNSLFYYPAGNPSGSSVHDCLNQWEPMRPFQRRAIETVVPRFLAAHPDHRIILYLSIAFDGEHADTLTTQDADGNVIALIDPRLSTHASILDRTIGPWAEVCTVPAAGTKTFPNRPRLICCFDGTSAHRETFWLLRGYLAATYGVSVATEAWWRDGGRVQELAGIDQLAFDHHIRPGHNWPNRDGIPAGARLHLGVKGAMNDDQMREALAAGVDLFEANFQFREVLAERREELKRRLTPKR